MSRIITQSAIIKARTTCCCSIGVRKQSAKRYPKANAKLTLQTRATLNLIGICSSRSISKAQIKELYSLQWLSEARPLLRVGQTGVGKTFIAQATGVHAGACGQSVLYMTVTTWLENLTLVRSNGAYLRYRDIPATIWPTTFSTCWFSFAWCGLAPVWWRGGSLGSRYLV
jgi:DNA replication protein DnaC